MQATATLETRRAGVFHLPLQVQGLAVQGGTQTQACRVGPSVQLAWQHLQAIAQGSRISALQRPALMAGKTVLAPRPELRKLRKKQGHATTGRLAVHAQRAQVQQRQALWGDRLKDLGSQSLVLQAQHLA